MMARQYLQAGSTIKLRGESDYETTFDREFTIEKRISEGAFAVCYLASHKGSRNGVLKEFYPKDLDILKRDKTTNQLIFTSEDPDDLESYAEKEKQYIETYNLLLNIQRDSDNQDLAYFIPQFDIYYGSNNAGEDIDTVYIWTQEPVTKTFEGICEEIHSHPEQDPKDKLYIVLSAIMTLTKCIKLLHEKGLVHRDITPSNFGFQTLEGEVQYQSVSLFDVNTICLINSDINNKEKIGKEGYMEPECGEKPAINKTDIYSIGATLFHAIIVNDEVKENGYIYKTEYYDRLPELVESSKLIEAIDTPYRSALIDILTRIFQKSLCVRSNRYGSCENMLRDIDRARFYITESIREQMDANKGKGHTRAIQYHLYEYPLYECVNETETIVHVLLIGFKDDGKRFLDQCLQVGQIRNKKLKVDVISEDKTSKKDYLDDRQELDNFFNVDDEFNDKNNNGSLTEDDIYGEISFCPQELKNAGKDKIADIVLEVMCEYDKDTHPQYVFIALEDEELNNTAASACLDDINDLGWDCAVNYVIDGKKDDKKKILTGKHVHPLYIDEDVKEQSLYNQIERMAFNANLIWEKNLYTRFNQIEEDFKDPYNHDSSVANVLSIKYKLYSIGIDLDKIDYNQAAKEYALMFPNNKKNKKLKNELIWIEHRRWVTEKICQGWRKRDVEECTDGNAKDEENKRHACIVRSRPNPDKILGSKKDWPRTKWNKSSKSELDQLDELDQMSVNLHRFLSNEAKEVKKQDFISDESADIEGIRATIEDSSRENNDAIIAFQEWYACLKDICIGNREKDYILNSRKVDLYDGLEDSLEEAVEAFPPKQAELIKRQLKEFNWKFKPVLESMRYHDWKHEDVALIENIPFILTYNADIHMVIPYVVSEDKNKQTNKYIKCKEDNNKIFENVAAPTYVNPAKITYLYSLKKATDIDGLCSSLPRVIAYFNKKKIRSEVDVILVHKKDHEYYGLEEKIKQAVGYDIDVSHCEAFTKDIIDTTLRQPFINDENTVVEKNDSELSGYMDHRDLYDDLRSYEFDTNKMEFDSLHDCDLLGYIKKKPYFTVSEMFTLTGAYCEHNSQPEFSEDYKELWAKYGKHQGAWKSLCGSLKNEAENHNKITTFGVKAQKEGEEEQKEEKYIYIVPFSCKKRLESVLDLLKEHSILTGGNNNQGYSSERYASDACKFTIWDTQKNKEKYRELFSNLYAFMIPGAVSQEYYNNSVNVVFNNLVVKEAEIDLKENDKVKELLDYFVEKGYINKLEVEYPEEESPNKETSQREKSEEETSKKDDKDKKIKYSFIYGSKQIKELLTQEGKIFEVYIYHKLKASGFFDDVVSGYEIRWNKTNDQTTAEKKPNNEFDCIVTKGFRSMFIECKARPKLDQVFYEKLDSLIPKFGINAQGVIIADTGETSERHNPTNDLQRERGYITIYLEDEIKDIDNVLIQVFNGEYGNEDSLTD